MKEIKFYFEVNKETTSEQVKEYLQKHFTGGTLLIGCGLWSKRVEEINFSFWERCYCFIVILKCDRVDALNYQHKIARHFKQESVLLTISEPAIYF